MLDWATGGVVLLVYAIAQLAFVQGPQPFDPAKYFKTAVDFPDVPADLWTLRIGLIAPVRVAVRIFGPSEAALYAVPFAIGLMLTAAVYVTMMLMFGQRTLAAASGLVVVLNTNYLLNSSYIFPDTAATATLTAGFLFLVLATARSTSSRRWLPTVSVVCAGVLFGWTYLIREFSLLFLPSVVAAVVLFRYPRRWIATLVGAAVGTVSIELLYGLALYGDPLIHVRRLIAHRGQREVPEQLDSVVDALLVFPRLLLAWSSGWAFLVMVALFVVALAWFRDRRLWVLASWCFIFWGLMTAIGVASLPSGRWILNVSNIRYWYPIFPALVMGAFGGISLLVRRFVPTHRGVLVTNVVTTALVVVTLIPGFAEFKSCSAKNVWRKDPAERWHELRAWLATPMADRYSVIWTDTKTQRLVPAFASTTFGDRLWHGRVERLRDRRPSIVPRTNPEHSLLLIHKDRFQRVSSARAKLNEVRAEWTPVFISDDGRMIVLAHESTTSGEPMYADRAWWNLTIRRPPATHGCGLRPRD
jgi:hypothetical protein